jgi:ribosomal protein L37AE/L43A
MLWTTDSFMLMRKGYTVYREGASSAMSSSSRREVMNSFERILARICLEHGWASRPQITDAVRARSQDPGAGTASLASLLVSRGVLTEEQAGTLQDEVSEVTRSGRYAEVREDDTWIGQLLVESGSATDQQVHEALAHQKECAARQVPVPRLGEILIDRGSLTFAKLQEALQRQSRLVRLACPSCGTQYAAEQDESTKVFLCEKCAVPLTGPAPSAPAAPSMPVEVTRAAEDPKNVLGKYILTAPVGKGAMGAVYKAWDRRLRRWVAIKLLLATSDPQLVARFRREAETAAAIQHPNIVPIYDVGESDGRPYLVMKYVEGSTLSGMSLALDQAIAVALQAAKGVAYAHEHDVVHRDLKPGNVMVDGSGHVTVMDFGLAKDLYGGPGMTAPGTVMGTPSYMPPEQATGKIQQVDRSSDVYSLGAILYELVTGRPPFQSPQAMEIIRQVIQDPVVPPSKLRPDLPPAIERVILRALEKDKAARFRTASELSKELEAAATKPVPAPPPVPAAVPVREGKSSKAMVFWVVVLAILSVLAGLGVIHLLKGTAAGGS